MHISGFCVQAPFLDVLGTMEDPSLPLTLEDREEWGDPTDNPEHRLTISSYCPLNNITPQVSKTLLNGLRWSLKFQISVIDFLKICCIYPTQTLTVYKFTLENVPKVSGQF